MKDLATWIVAFRAAITSIIETGNTPYSHSTCSRITAFACCPLCCGVCISWSVIWRCIAFPFVCLLSKGAACGGNGCTECSDIAVAAYVDDINKHQQLCSLPPLTNASIAELNELLNAIHDLENHFTDVNHECGTLRRALVRSVVGPLVAGTPGMVVTLFNAADALKKTRLFVIHTIVARGVEKDEL